MYGSSTDLWGTTWSYSDFGSNFRIKLQINATLADDYFINVDHIQIKVYYTIETLKADQLTIGFLDNSIRGAKIHGKSTTFDIGVQDNR